MRVELEDTKAVQTEDTTLQFVTDDNKRNAWKMMMMPNTR